MKKPAARQNDLTAHGGTISLGLPTVLIGGQPAARVMDLHTCPMVTANVPHGGGPIQTGSTSVLIGGQKAARVGDMLFCTGPPDTISSGCQSVLIGDTSAGGGSGSLSASEGALAGALTTEPEEDEETEPVYPYILLTPEACGFQDDDRFILESTDGSYSETLTFADAENQTYMAVLHFPDPPRGARYSLHVEQAERPDRDADYARTSYTIFQDEPLMRFEMIDVPVHESGLRS